MAKELIKRKNGSVSQRGLWDNIRSNKGSGKKSTKAKAKGNSKGKQFVKQPKGIAEKASQFR